MKYTPEALAAAARVEAAVKELVHAVADAAPFAKAELSKPAQGDFGKLRRAAAKAHQAALDLHGAHLAGDVAIRSGAT
jgi:hypothetical protein